MWTKFEIDSARTVDFAGIPKKYVVYGIKISNVATKNFQEGVDDNQAIFIERRYTDFLELYNSLKQTHPWITDRVSFPRKVLLGNFSRELIQTRAFSLRNFLKVISENNTLLDSIEFKTFLIGHDEKVARLLLEAKDYYQAKPLLETNYRILNKIYTERHHAVIVALCRLVACCNAVPAFLEDAKKYSDVALRRFDGISDIDLLYYYIPLLQMCLHLWRALGIDRETLELKLTSLRRSGHRVDGRPTLLESILATE